MGKGQHNPVPFEATMEVLVEPLVVADPIPVVSAEAAVGEVPKRKGTFVQGNKMAKWRAIQNRARGISSLSPAAVPTFMKADVAAGVSYLGEMLRLLEDRPVLLPLAGVVADALTVGRSMLKEALKALRDPAKSGMTDKEIMAKLTHAQSWLDRHERYLTTLTKLRGSENLGTADTEAMRRVKAAVEAAAKEQAKADQNAIDAEGTVEEPEPETVEVVDPMEALRRQIGGSAGEGAPSPVHTQAPSPLAAHFAERAAQAHANAQDRISAALAATPDSTK